MRLTLYGCRSIGVLLWVILLVGCTSMPRYLREPAQPTVKPHGRYEETGVASYYGTDFHGKNTSSGEPYNMYAMTAAHRTLPFGTKVRVKNLKNSRTVIVTINDRGPFVKGRIIDLSFGAARAIGMIGPGTTRVRIEVISWGEE